MIKWIVKEAAEAIDDSEFKEMAIVMVEVSELKELIERFMEFAVEEESLAFASRLLEELE